MQQAPISKKLAYGAKRSGQTELHLTVDCPDIWQEMFLVLASTVLAYRRDPPAHNCSGARGWMRPVFSTSVMKVVEGSPRRRQKRTGGRLPSEVAWFETKDASLVKNSSLISKKGGRVGEQRRDCGVRNLFGWHIE